MRLIGLMPVRSEDWILGLSARVALMWCDILVMLDHASTDNTREIMRDVEREHPGRTVIVVEDDPLWDEMNHRQTMLSFARDASATHVAIIDADEILTGNLLPTIRYTVEQIPRGYIMQVPGYNLRGGLDRYHSNGIWGRRWFSLAFMDSPAYKWEGNCFHRREPIGLGNHAFQAYAQGHAGIMHLWGASERRLKAKHALYKITERLRWPQKSVKEIDRLYSLSIHGDGNDTPSSWQYQAVQENWWQPYLDLRGQYLNLDAEPWQEQAVRNAIAEHGAGHFTGLDLFGVNAC